MCLCECGYKCLNINNACKCGNGRPAWWALAFLAPTHLYNSICYCTVPCLVFEMEIIYDWLIDQPELYRSAWNFAWRFGHISDRSSPILLQGWLSYGHHRGHMTGYASRWSTCCQHIVRSNDTLRYTEIIKICRTDLQPVCGCLFCSKFFFVPTARHGLSQLLKLRRVTQFAQNQHCLPYKNWRIHSWCICKQFILGLIV